MDIDTRPDEMTLNEKLDEIIESAFEQYVDCINKTNNELGICSPKIYQIREQIKEVIEKDVQLMGFNLKL